MKLKKSIFICLTILMICLMGTAFIKIQNIQKIALNSDTAKQRALMQCGHDEGDYSWEEVEDGHKGTCGICGATVWGLHDSSNDWENGVCKYCGFVCTHSWNSSTGKCDECNEECNHNYDSTGKCTICGKECTHVWDSTTGKCTKCEIQCEHEWNRESDLSSTGICKICGYECKHEVWEAVSLDGHACEKCDKYEEHTFGEYEIKEEPTCTKKGSKERKCTKCGKIELKEIAAIGHDWNSTTGKCNICEIQCEHEWNRESDLSSTGICKICGYECKHEVWEAVTLDGHACKECDKYEIHTWDATTGKCTKCGTICTHNWSNATCEKPKTCTICGMTEGEALGHSWKEATCETAKTCERCGKTEGEALGHNWKEATCETAKTCERCGKTEGEALGHSWKEATCETAKTCERCGKTEGEALGHSWKEATCETAKTCERCGKTEGEAKGHTEVIYKKVEPTCTQAGLTEGKHCSVCNEVLQVQAKISALGHDYKSVVTKPTTTKQGYTTHTCTRCGDSYKDSYTAPIAEPESLYVASNTYNVGDKYISKIKPETTVKTLKEKLSTNEKTEVVVKNNGTTLKETDYIGTGMKITFKLGEETKEYTLVVTGDLTGDGKLQNGDLIKLVRYRVELITLEEPYKRAADVNGDGKVTDSDIIVIARVLVNLKEL